MLKFAIPTIDRKLCTHFGRCNEFAIIVIENNKMISNEFVKPPYHEPGVYPKWLHDQGVTHIISAGMGRKAQALFEQYNIEVCVGADTKSPEELVMDYVDNNLIVGENLCEH
jgi:predicted Fe-Mo cluster-binding NifX family protein